MSLVLCAVAAMLALGHAPTCARARDQDKRSSVVFFAPQEVSAKVRVALEDALTTQLSLIQTTLRFELATGERAAPPERLQIAKQVAAKSGALGVFWLDAAGDGPWLLYAVDARAERMVVRKLESRKKSSEPEADIEAVALIVRATTQALLHGEPLPSLNTGEETEFKLNTTPWPVERLDAGESALRIAIAYVGTTFTKQLPLQHGFALRGAWLWPSGTYVGLGFTLVPTSKFNLQRVQFEIDRYPFSLHAGLRFGFSRLTFIGELGAELEVRKRRTLAAASLEPFQDEQRILYNVCPKLETELALAPWLVAFVSAGLDVVIGNFAYSSRNEKTMETTPILEPHWIRLTIQAGIGVIH